MKTFIAGVFVVVIVACFARHGASAEQADGGDQTFNPFAKSEEPEKPTTERTKPARVSARISDDTAEPAEETGFKWPSFPRPKLPVIPKPSLPKFSLPSWTSEKEMDSHQARQTDEPTTWNKFTSGTKDLFSKTKQTLMPWSDEEESPSARRPAPPPRRTASRSTARSKSQGNSSEKKSFFSWFSKREEEKGPETVTDFLRQPRVDINSD